MAVIKTIWLLFMFFSNFDDRIVWFLINSTFHKVPIKLGQSQESLFKDSMIPQGAIPCLVASPKQEGHPQGQLPTSSPEAIIDSMSCSRTLQRGSAQAQGIKPEGHLTNNCASLLPKNIPKYNCSAKSGDLKVLFND